MDALVLDVTCRAVSNSLILASTILPLIQHADDRRRRDDTYGEKGLDTLVVCKVSAHDEMLSLMLLIVDVMIIEARSSLVQSRVVYQIWIWCVSCVYEYCMPFDL